MANQTTGGAGDGHQQSIGGDSPLPVDGIAGGHAGLQEPAGADVNAGLPGGPKLPGVPQPSGTSGAPGPAKASQSARRWGAPAVKYNGSVARGGKAVSVHVGCGSLGQRGL